MHRVLWLDAVVQSCDEYDTACPDAILAGVDECWFGISIRGLPDGGFHENNDADAAVGCCIWVAGKWPDPLLCIMLLCCWHWNGGL
ncbi:hypothetical protein Nepgr_023247 [Nepenthes gracilis]|uniref:Uncharacterized protein n=1 Tax=Nepenthes gracilis TaxID=150966 RepID=A0AAD3XYX8_NEPGR|nr:hypothetical protein Nepgr_023247 [Nepenthes gracilis]